MLGFIHILFISISKNYLKKYLVVEEKKFLLIFPSFSISRKILIETGNAISWTTRSIQLIQHSTRFTNFIGRLDRRNDGNYPVGTIRQISQAEIQAWRVLERRGTGILQSTDESP